MYIINYSQVEAEYYEAILSTTSILTFLKNKISTTKKHKPLF
ncbi:hypothetical protein PLUTE_a4359 [Pseudoalteromonas luteoviolacea DSM 6061]|nr:hypothetical protein [Pseudoalteromonas luteoviolacea DSM 6061]